METKDIKKLIAELIAMMDDSKLTELEVELEDARICLRRESSEQKHTVVALPTPTVAMPVIGTAPIGIGEPAATAPEPESTTRKIVSPMVGTFYQTPSPEADPYVEVGDTVEEDTVVCTIEAMKVMNEIKAEMTGKIVELLVNNGEAVEYGQPLFLVEPTA